MLWGACDPLTTPRPLGPVPRPRRPAGRRRHRDAAQRRASPTRSSRPCSSTSGSTRPSSSWTTCTGPTRAPIDLLRFLLRRVRITGSLVVGAMRDDEVGATHPLRALLGDIARSPDAATTTLRPLSVAAVATLIGDRPIDANVAAPAHRGQPVLRGRDARPRRSRDPGHRAGRGAGPHQRPGRREPGTSSTCWRARPKRSRTRCSPPSASGCPPCATSTGPA